MTVSVAIVGAGLAGITVARELSRIARVCVFEKSRGLGGRMATRRAGDHEFDHGAQFFTSRSPEFQQLLHGPDIAATVRPWQPKVVTLEPGKKPFKRPWFEDHYVAVPRMNLLVKTLAADLQVRVDTRVSDVVASGPRWQLVAESGEQLGEFDWVVSAAPAAQAAALLPAVFIPLDILRRARFSPCFALMIGLPGLPNPGFDCAVVRDSPLAWLAMNHSKPGRPETACLVAQSDNQWAADHVDDDPQQLQQQLQRSVEDLTGIDTGAAEYLALHRWLYARVEEPAAGEGFLLDREHQLAACGDWCVGNRVEDAFTSGAALGRALRKTISQGG